MANQKKLVLIPYWIQDTLKRNPTATLATCLDFPKLRPLVALNDMVVFETLQKYFDHLLGGRETCNSFDLSSCWADSIPNDQAQMRALMYNSVLGPADALEFRKEVWTRLFEAEAKLPQFDEPFTCHDLSPDVLGIVIYPGFFVASDTHELQLSLMEAILKVLYVYTTYSEVAKTPLYKRYLELLSVH